MNLEQVDVVAFLQELGIRNIKEDGQEVKFSCPFSGHKNGDANPSASMQLETTLTHCFGCGWSGNAITFLSNMEGVPPLKATQWIRERFGNGFLEPGEIGLLGEVNNIINSANNSLREPYKGNKIIPESEADKRRMDWSDATLKGDPRLEYLLSRKFNLPTLSEFDIGWDSISERLTIPIRDHVGNLVGFKGRGLPGNEPRYLVLGGSEYGFDPYETAEVVFGLDRVAPARELILCEGELNAIAMHQKGFINTVGISGKHLSWSQSLLLRAHCDKVTLIFDEKEDATRACYKLDQYIPVKIVPDHEQDPADLERSEILNLLENSELSILV